jgi:hypothetical protein
MTTVKSLSILCTACLLITASGTSSVLAQTLADRNDAAVAYAQCVRDHGYAEFPDPQPDGGFKFLIVPGGVSRFKAAADACRDLAPAGMRDEAVTPEQLDALIKLSQCVRQNGVSGFPDPTSDGRFELDGTSVKPGDKTFEAAMTACRDLAKDAPIMIGG